MAGVRCQFPQQAAASSLIVLAQTNSSLWTTVFSTAEAADHCIHCLSVDHMSDECHKYSRSKKLLDEDAGPSTSRAQARHVVQPICKSWNYSHCVSATCAYRHVCLEYRENHRVVQCPHQQALPAISESQAWRRREGNDQEAGLSWPAGLPPPLSHTAPHTITH